MADFGFVALTANELAAQVRAARIHAARARNPAVRAGKRAGWFKGSRAVSTCRDFGGKLACELRMAMPNRYDR